MPKSAVRSPSLAATGYPREHLLLRAVLPVALAIYFFLHHDAPRSDTLSPRGPASAESVQP
ncbi:MAG: hypothetical protein Q8J74_03095 [Candidatus Didemnitutus sp.]|nr:hypothetical protein [Candidatus Didemnitutus sp.]